jgi:hypothetical protein
MTDLKRRVARLDDLEAPDLWSEIAARSTASSTTLERVAIAGRGTGDQMTTEPRADRRARRPRALLWAAALTILAVLAAAAIYVGTRPAQGFVTNGQILLASEGALVSVDPISGSLAPADLRLGCEPTCPAISSVAWSSDGTLLAYASDGFLWVHDMRSGQSRKISACCVSKLSFAPGAEPQAIDWSPDGTSLVFSHLGDLWVIGADGSDLRRIVAPKAGGAGQPSWLNDGRRIGFSLVEGDTYSIAVHDLDSTATTSVVTGDGPYWGAAWSPDGSRIAYFTGAIPTRLNSARPDGSDPITLLEVPLCCTITIPAAEWSPDGQLLAVVIQDLLLVEPDGSGFRRLGSGIAADRPAWHPVWVPDAGTTREAFDTPGALTPVRREPAATVSAPLVSMDVDVRSLAPIDLDIGQVVSFDAIGADIQLSSATRTERFFSNYREAPMVHVLVEGGVGGSARPLGPEGCVEALAAPEDIGIVLLGQAAVSLDALTAQSHLCTTTDEGNVAEFWPIDHAALGDATFTVHVEVWRLP